MCKDHQKTTEKPNWKFCIIVTSSGPTGNCAGSTSGGHNPFPFCFLDPVVP